MNTSFKNDDREKVQVKKEFLRMITKMELTPAKMRFILGFFERYVKLNEREEEILMTEIKQMDESEDIMHLPISWEEKGIEKGKSEVALEMLKEGLSIELIMKVTALDRENIEKLKQKMNG